MEPGILEMDYTTYTPTHVDVTLDFPPCTGCSRALPRIAWASKIKFEFLFTGFWPNPGPGRLPLDSGRRDVKFAGVFASVAFLTVSFVRKSIFWNPVQKKVLKFARAMAGILIFRAELSTRTFVV